LRKTSNATPSLVAGELADEADLEETCAAAGVENAAEPVAAALGVEAPAANGAPVGPNAVADGGADFDEYGDEFWDEKEEGEAEEDLDATWSKDWAEGLLDRKNDPGGYVEDGFVIQDVQDMSNSSGEESSGSDAEDSSSEEEGEKPATAGAKKEDSSESDDEDISSEEEGEKPAAPAAKKEDSSDSDEEKKLAAKTAAKKDSSDSNAADAAAKAHKEEVDTPVALVAQKAGAPVQIQTVLAQEQESTAAGSNVLGVQSMDTAMLLGHNEIDARRILLFDAFGKRIADRQAAGVEAEVTSKLEVFG
jgi:hypothetical protein